MGIRCDLINVHQVHDNYVTWVYCVSISKQTVVGLSKLEKDKSVEKYKNLPPLILVKQFPKYLPISKGRKVENNMIYQEMQMMKCLTKGEGE